MLYRLVRRAWWLAASGEQAHAIEQPDRRCRPREHQADPALHDIRRGYQLVPLPRPAPRAPQGLES